MCTLAWHTVYCSLLQKIQKHFFGCNLPFLIFYRLYNTVLLVFLWNLHSSLVFTHPFQKKQITREEIKQYNNLPYINLQKIECVKGYMYVKEHA